MLECTKEKILEQVDVRLSKRDVTLLAKRGHDRITTLGDFAGRQQIGQWLNLSKCRISGGPRRIYILFFIGPYTPPAWKHVLREMYKGRLSFTRDHGDDWAIIEVSARRLPIRDPKRFIEAEARRIAHAIAKFYL